MAENIIPEVSAVAVPVSAKRRGKSPAPVGVPLRATFTVSGVRKSAEFTAGVEAALGVLGATEGAADNLQSDVRTRDVAFLGLHELVLKGGAFAEGAIAAVAAYIEFHLETGTPNLAAWRPFSYPWHGDGDEIPPEDSLFFEIDGAPYSVDPNLDTARWFSETESQAVPVDSIRSQAVPISRARFDLLRWEVGRAKRAQEELGRVAQSN